ncbi:hypothetical protein ACQPZJ_17940 [Actinoplanes sp. CA-054009]
MRKRATAAAVAAALMTVAVPEAAQAGQNHCAWIGAAVGGGGVRLEQNCGVSGTYHMDIWGAGHPRTHTRDYRYTGGARDFFFRWAVAPGATVCGELWYHKPGGGYESNGLPCWTRP